jgi:hypothetical protein
MRGRTGIRFTILAVLCALLTGCFGSMQVKREGSRSFQKPFDDVWAASLKALNEMEFTVTSTKKDQIGLPAFKKWSGTITAEGSKNVLLQAKPPRLNITVRDKGGKIEVICEAIQDKQMIDYGISSKNKNRFLEILDRLLRK